MKPHPYIIVILALTPYCFISFILPTQTHKKFYNLNPILLISLN